MPENSFRFGEPNSALLRRPGNPSARRDMGLRLVAVRPDRRRFRSPWLLLGTRIAFTSLLVFLGVPAFAADLPPLGSFVARTDRVSDEALPEGAQVRFGALRWRYLQEISCLAVSPDGKRVATGSHSNKVLLWDA